MTQSLLEGIPPGALSGIRVLDFTHALAGPTCTMILGDLGAEILKVEHPGGGDRTRRYTDGDDDFSAYFGSINRNKLSAIIDLKAAAGQELAHRLADKADVVVVNLGPGVAQRIGLDYPTLQALNPRLICAYATGYGLDGPWADQVGIDPVIQPLSGSMSITGEPGGPPIRVGYSIVDLIGGMYLVIGVLAALQERERSGKGQQLDVSLLEAQMALMENAVARYLHTGVTPRPVGSAHPYQTLSRAYETKNGWMICLISARNWKAACKVLGREDWLADPELQSKPEKNGEKLLPEIQRILRSRDKEYWVERLVPAGVRCVPVNSIADAVKLPPIVERGFIQETVDGKGRKQRIAGSPVRLSRTPGRVRTAAPLLGEHTRCALQDWLGIGEEEFRRYAEQGVFDERGMDTRGFW